MTRTVTTRSTDGFESTSTIRAFSVELDPGGEAAPDTVESLLATYAACYIPALRVSADKFELGDLGAIEIDVEGSVDDAGKLTGVAFAVTTDAGLDGEGAASVVENANALCKVHAAIRPELRAAVTLDGHPVG